MADKTKKYYIKGVPTEAQMKQVIAGLAADYDAEQEAQKKVREAKKKKG